MNNCILVVGVGGVFSKFIFVIWNSNKKNSDFKLIYINDINNRFLIRGDNIFELFLDKTEDKTWLVMVCNHLVK